LTTALGCASTTDSNPPGPPPAWKQPYAGRIVLATPVLPDEVTRFDRFWSQRLSILGLPARIIYDDTHAIFDVYGAPPSALSGVASALADPGGWMDHALDESFLVEWTPPTPACDCGGEMLVRVSGPEMCRWSTTTTTPIELRRPGSPSLWVAGWRVLWHFRVKLGANLEGYAEGDSDVAKEGLKCPEEQWPKVRVRLLPQTSPEQATAVALALGGGRLPQLPRVESVMAAGAPRQP
jgi:hypothetical protein